ncbi:leucine-rich repeat-containing protein 51 [Oryzias melastigma]|uniref:Leucine-rich repeat-containing protein 51 n=1 Tax=Oryzias melastigma TaxID=30732 RepID=A0A3B3CV91_ORYME|nr:leucine-rich repeat-containing protein 51 [Oryzias melastigma]
MYAPPVDLSFNEISSVTDALSKVPRRGRRPLKTDSQGKYLSRSLRLDNNHITEVSNLQCVLSHFLVQPSSIGWLDLSFNKITSISAVLSELHELHVLYLHGNQIANLADVNKLGRLMNLHTITLHGNPIEYMEDYRNRVVFTLPHLKRMDFSAVTPQDHFLANVFGRRLKRKNT